MLVDSRKEKHDCLTRSPSRPGIPGAPGKPSLPRRPSGPGSPFNRKINYFTNVFSMHNFFSFLIVVVFLV